MLAHLSKPRTFFVLFTFAALGLLACILLGASASARSAPGGVASSNTASGARSSVPYTLCGTLSFAAPITYTANTRTRSSATGYLNADNNLDLVVTDYTAG